MKYLIDTCTYIWIITNHEKLSSKVGEIFQDKNNQIYLSIISQIEMSVKHIKHKIPGISKPILHYFHEFRVESEINLLNLLPEDIEGIFKLPKIHSDPFDRILISQAINHDMTILTPDKKFTKYPVKIVF